VQIHVRHLTRPEANRSHFHHAGANHRDERDERKCAGRGQRAGGRAHPREQSEYVAGKHEKKDRPQKWEELIGFVVMVRVVRNGRPCDLIADEHEHPLE
jgi:hypothetical protein